MLMEIVCMMRCLYKNMLKMIPVFGVIFLLIQGISQAGMDYTFIENKLYYIDYLENNDKLKTCSYSCANDLPALFSPLKGNIANRNVLSKFGDEWTYTYCGASPKRHTGVDLAAQNDEDVYAVDDGNIKAVYDASSIYNWAKGIVIQHNGFTAVYLHVNPIVSSGSVKRGQKIAKIAAIDGNDHLHFGIMCGVYSEISKRGALPSKRGTSDYENGKTTYCKSDPIFPGAFINPLAIVYDTQDIISQNIVKKPSSPVLISPGSSTKPGDQIDTLSPKFAWRPSTIAEFYSLYISKEPYGEKNLVFNSENLKEISIKGDNFKLPINLEPGVNYRWNMIAHNSGGSSGISNTLYFVIPNSVSSGQASSHIKSNQPPFAPDALLQLNSDQSIIARGGETFDKDISFRAKLNDPDGDKINLEIELRRLDEYQGSFKEIRNDFKQSGYVENNGITTAYAMDLIDGKYHWRARAVDEHGKTSQWVDFGGNSISDADFQKKTASSKAKDTPIIQPKACPPASGVAGKDIPQYAPDFYDRVLSNLGIPNTDFARKALIEWTRFENTGAYWNPLATTWDKGENCCKYNNANVKHYIDKETGIKATSDTIKPSKDPLRYKAILQMLELNEFNKDELKKELAKWSGLGSEDTYIVNLVNTWWNIYPNNSVKQSSNNANMESNEIPAIGFASSPIDSQITAGMVKAWTIDGKDPEGDEIEYRFELDKQVVQDWSKSNSWNWNPSESSVGTHLLIMKIRDNYHDKGDKGDSSMGDVITVLSGASKKKEENKPPAISNLIVDMTSPQKVGKVITWYGIATDPENDEIFYKFFLNGNPVTDWVTDNKWIWTATESCIGENSIEVQVRDGKHVGPDSFDNSLLKRYVITKPESSKANENTNSVKGTYTIIDKIKPKDIYDAETDDEPEIPPEQDYCEKQGFGYKDGLCLFPDGSSCDAVSFLLKDCTYNPSSSSELKSKDTGIITVSPPPEEISNSPAESYCKEQGFGYKDGLCLFPDGTSCDADSFLLGDCSYNPQPPVLSDSQVDGEIQADNIETYGPPNSQEIITIPTAVPVIVSVKDAWSNPISDVQVIVQDGNGDTIQRTTDPNGYTTITGSPGMWFVTANAQGYLPYDGSSEVSSTATSTSIGIILQVDETGSQVNTIEVDPIEVDPIEVVPIDPDPSIIEDPLTNFEANTASSQQYNLPIAVPVVVSVKDAWSSPVSGAQVSVQDGNGNTIQRVTDPNGYTTITGSPGMWFVTANAQGYLPYDGSSEVSSTATSTSIGIILQLDETGSQRNIMGDTIGQPSIIQSTFDEPVTNSDSYIQPPQINLPASVPVEISVEDAWSNPISGAQIIIQDGNGETISGIADLNGRATIAGKPGMWFMKVSAPGYLTNTNSLEVSSTASSTSSRVFLQKEETS